MLAIRLSKEMEARMDRFDDKNVFIRGYLSDRTDQELRDKIALKYSYPTNHLPVPSVDSITFETCFLTARER